MEDFPPIMPIPKDEGDGNLLDPLQDEEDFKLPEPPPIDNTEFMLWLEKQCVRKKIKNWRHLAKRSVERARAAGLDRTYAFSATTITNLKKNKRRVGDDVARAIALALGINQIYVFKEAKLITDSDPTALEEMAVVNDMAADLDPEDRQEAISMMELLISQKQLTAKQRARTKAGR